MTVWQESIAQSTRSFTKFFGPKLADTLRVFQADAAVLIPLVQLGRFIDLERFTSDRKQSVSSRFPFLSYTATALQAASQGSPNDLHAACGQELAARSSGHAHTTVVGGRRALIIHCCEGSPKLGLRVLTVPRSSKASANSLTKLLSNSTRHWMKMR